ncbi:MAG: D-alanyl-D-alanine dipeptidase [Alphaproteobacteria bacterium]|nr:D-alanyl-D-alanine dipeptidase [Alphaproteobacteria bacterium]|tara:strand:- start:627 stop:1178 length:552 start_codon:yes stop_codon:yes gene_type:complete
MPLVEITRSEFDVDIELAYATDQNFTGAPIYRRNACFLHSEASSLLRRVIELAAPLGLRLKILDGFRPTEAQWALWTHTPHAEFVADPRRGSPHSRGAAIDLTLLDSTGAELDMGTGFDEFSDRAHHGSQEINSTAQRNRALLLGLMTMAGFDHYRLEWWHYQLHDSHRLPLFSDSAAGTRLM